MRLQHFARRLSKTDNKKEKTQITFTPWFLFTFVISLVLIPFGLFFSWLLAAVVHELFHYIAICTCRIPVLSVAVGAGGAKICTEPLTVRQECFCALAGPIGGLLLLFLSSYVPTVAVCAYFQSIYNLLPIYPMDGGRAIHCLIYSFFQGKTARIVEKIWIWIVLVSISMVGIWLSFVCNLGILPVVAVGFLVLQNKKSLANSRGNEYNVCSYALNQ